MKINKSPWIHQLDHTRKMVTLTSDVDTDVVVVGAGIAGISTAFFLLKYTKHRVVIVEQGKLAHGATGHNAGQVVARFERPLHELVAEFGLEKTKRALHDLQSAWVLIDEMYTDANLDILFSRVHGVRGFSSLDQVLEILKDMEIEHVSGLSINKLLISEEAPFREMLPRAMSSLYSFVPHKEILGALETEYTDFHAVLIDQAACMNSALFCQEVMGYLQKEYADRFALYENTRIEKLVLKENHALLDAGKHTINTHKVILCTNGFEKLEIFNEGGLEIDKRFHHSVEGVVGYMSGYLETMNKSGIAIAYYMKENKPVSEHEDAYFYLTRRPHEMGDTKHNLVCMGGPEVLISDREEYLNDYDYPEQMQNDIDNFVKKVYDTDPNRKIDYQFTWHGLMGYTPNKVRLIGAEPKNPVLLYNLGCNGIGIIPSIFGGRKIARIISGEKLESSIFDPRLSGKS
jgi:glycine/D-amino acid oxidase-like deaminating enzyme